MELADDACWVVIAVEPSPEQACLFGLAIAVGFLDRDHSPLGLGVIRAQRAGPAPAHMDRMGGLEAFDLGLRSQDLGPDLEAAVQLIFILARQDRELC